MSNSKKINIIQINDIMIYYIKCHVVGGNVMKNKRMEITIFNELSELISIRMKSCFEMKKDTDWIEHKSHNDYDLWFIQAGSITIHIDGKEHIARPGDVVFYYPQMPYRATSSPEGCQFIYIHFDFEIGGRERILNDFPLAGIIPKGKIHKEASQFVETFTSSQPLNSMPGKLLHLKACLMSMIAKIIEIYGEGEYIGDFLEGTKWRKSKKNLENLQPVFKYIHDNMNKPILMMELAEVAGMSEKYFISYFKKALGITPGQYISQIKMNMARDYLYEQKYTIQEISRFLGYSDPFTFSKAFKKYYNVAPSKFI